jgi:hypothetical protein
MGNLLNSITPIKRRSSPTASPALAPTVPEGGNDAEGEVGPANPFRAGAGFNPNALAEAAPVMVKPEAPFSPSEPVPQAGWEMHFNPQLKSLQIMSDDVDVKATVAAVEGRLTVTFRW